MSSGRLAAAEPEIPAPRGRDAIAGGRALHIIVVPILRLAAIAGQLIYVKVYTSRLGNHELGLYFFLLTAAYSANALLFVPVDYYQQSLVYGYVSRKQSLMPLVQLNWVLVGWTAVAGLALAMCAAVFSRTAAVHVGLAVLFSLSLYVTTALKNLLNNLEHRLLVAAIFVIEVAAKVGLFLIALRIVGSGYVPLIESNLVALGVVFLILAAAAIRLGLLRGSPGEPIRARDVLRTAGPVSVGSIANWVQLQGYRAMLVPLGYTGIVGAYGAVSNVGTTGMNAASVVFGQLFVPDIYKSGGRYTRNYLRNALLLTVVIALGAALVANRLVLLLTRADLVPYSRALLFGVGAEAGNFLMGALVIHATLRQRAAEVMRASLVGVATWAALFTVLYASRAITVYSIGLPIVLSQAAVVVYMTMALRRPHHA